METAIQSRLNLVQMPPKTRRSVACNHCRAKKIRCMPDSPAFQDWLMFNVSIGNGNTPCANCLDRAEECVVTPRRRPHVQNSRKTDELVAHQSTSTSRRFVCLGHTTTSRRLIIDRAIQAHTPRRMQVLSINNHEKVPPDLFVRPPESA